MKKPKVIVKDPSKIEIKDNRIVSRNSVIRVKVSYGVREYFTIFGVNEEIDIKRFVRYIIRELKEELHAKEKTLKDNMVVVIE
jgi:uncharacterized membrane-anchored protein